MAEVGIIGTDDRLELTKGEIIVISPKGHKYSHVLQNIIEAFPYQKDRYGIQV